MGERLIYYYSPLPETVAGQRYP